MTGLDTTHTTLRLLDGTYPYGLNFPTGSVATVVGPGATLTGTNFGGGVITVIDNSVITVRGLTIDAGGGAFPVHCQAASTGMSTVTLRDIYQVEFAAELFSVNCKTTVLSSRLQSRIESTGGGSIAIDRTSFQGLYAQFGNHLVIDIQNSVMLEGVNMSGDQTAYPVSGQIAFSTFKMQTWQSCGSAPLSFDNNIFFSTNVGAPGYAISHGAGCTSIFDHNLAFPQDAPLGNAMLIEDPKFVDATNGDFHLMVGSPAIDFGNSAATDNIDLDGVSRPQGNGRDLGAFEYH